ncbi:MAG: aldehyde-activating protein [Candidatus Puniceispirillum sp.]|nr:aldehyde-activating protein [Candidatus Puniceispirillum sp.]
MTLDTHLTGGCFCGAVRFRLEAPPLKIGVCHCQACKKLTGGTSWSFALALTDALHVTGEVREVTRMSESGYPVHVGFCPACGTTLMSRSDHWAQFRTLSVGAFDDTDGLTTSFHIWTKSAYPWEIMPEGARCFEGHLPEKSPS